MVYRTKDFTSPTGGIMIFAEYSTETKELLFKTAKGYLYPQDSKNMIDGINTKHFIKDYSTFRDSVEEAAEYLKDMAIYYSFEEITE